jgi:hypothetical protein
VFIMLILDLNFFGRKQILNNNQCSSKYYGTKKILIRGRIVRKCSIFYIWVWSLKAWKDYIGIKLGIYYNFNHEKLYKI